MLTWFQRSFFYREQLHKKLFVGILCATLLECYGWTFANMEYLSWFLVKDND
jgi:hypothetical protein